MSAELMHRNIERAQKRIDETKESVSHGAMRQRYHFMAQAGWINDPNGLIFYKGKYHYFYQYNPYYGFWDYMHWGHAVSEDLVHWTYLPLALAPSEIYDDHMRGGCFSGSAIEFDGKLFLVFTGVTNEGKGFDQTQNIAYSEDGIHFTKYEGNPVLRAPEGVPTPFFRDPKVWKHGDYIYMVVGASCEGKGQARLYRTKDMFHWDFVNVLAESRGEWGYMWECPDFFKLGDKYVLLFSPMGGGERTSVYLTGDFDYETGKFDWHGSGAIDWGFEYYAPQSFLAPDGRRILVAWANCWDWMPIWKDWGPTYKEGWCGHFNIPREARLMADGTLQFIPVKELNALRETPRNYGEMTVHDGEMTEIEAGDGVAYEWNMAVDLKKTTAEQIKLCLLCGEGRATVCTFDLNKAEMSVDKNNADGWSKGRSRSTLFLKGKDSLDIHVFADQSSVEVFADQYRISHSMNVYAPNSQDRNYIEAVGGQVEVTGMETYGLKKVM